VVLGKLILAHGWAPASHLALCQRMPAEKSNEIVAIPELIKTPTFCFFLAI